METDYLNRRYEYLNEQETGTLIDRAREVGLEWVFVENISPGYDKEHGCKDSNDLYLAVNNAVVSWLSDRFNIPKNDLYSPRIANFGLPLPQKTRSGPHGDRKLVLPEEIISGIGVLFSGNYEFQINFPLTLPDLTGEEIVQRGFINAYALEQEHYERKPFIFEARPTVVEITNGYRTTRFDTGKSDGCTTGCLSGGETRQYVAKFPQVSIEEVIRKKDYYKPYTETEKKEFYALLKKTEEQQSSLMKQIER